MTTANLSGAFSTTHGGTLTIQPISHRMLDGGPRVLGRGGAFGIAEVVPFNGAATSAHAGTFNPVSWSGALQLHNLVITMNERPSTDVSVSLSWSDNKGATYGNSVRRDFSTIGKYINSLKWQRLGMARDRVFVLEWSAPCETSLTGIFYIVKGSQS